MTTNNQNLYPDPGSSMDAGTGTIVLGQQDGLTENSAVEFTLESDQTVDISQLYLGDDDSTWEIKQLNGTTKLLAKGDPAATYYNDNPEHNAFTTDGTLGQIQSLAGPNNDFAPITLVPDQAGTAVIGVRPQWDVVNGRYYKIKFK